MRRFFLHICCLFLSFAAISCDIQKGDEAVSVSLPAESVTRQGGSIAVTISTSGAWSLELEFLGEGEPWARLNKTEGVSLSESYGTFIYYEANNGDEPRTLRVVLKSMGKTETASLVQTTSDKNHDEGGDDPDTGPDAVPGWMELPAMQSGLEYYNHHFTMDNGDGKKYRNYSFGWDRDALVAHWVAYPLCKFYTNKRVERKDLWRTDPKLDSIANPIMHHGLGGGYDRGHQLPSADRLCCRNANKQTFYFTNLTPQIGRTMNQSIWENLEGHVRQISGNADTLYVVTGCVVDGSTKTWRDNDGKDITVPVGYFKALLYYSRANTFGLGGYSAAGYYLEHRSYSGNENYNNYLMSLDRLEEITGIDFFVNLTSRLGANNAAKVESEDPAKVSIWR